MLLIQEVVQHPNTAAGLAVCAQMIMTKVISLLQIILLHWPEIQAGILFELFWNT